MIRAILSERRVLRATQIAAALILALLLPTAASAGEGPGAQHHDDWGAFSELRPDGRYANFFARRALRKCEWADPYEDGDSAEYAYAFAFYAADFGEQAGYVVCWYADDWSDPARDEAYDVYFALRYQQGLYDYYASLHAQIAFQETGKGEWRDAAKFAQAAALYARYDLTD